MNQILLRMSTFIATQVMCLVIFLFLLLFTYVFTLKFNNHTSKTLALFLDIDNGRIKKYINNCEQFTVFVQQREADDNEFEEEEENEADMLDRTLFLQRKRRRNNAV